jgi:DNA-binding LacI/PurR family transcriptional regulator
VKSTTMEDVAREAGVSRALVSIAFRGVAGVSDETRDRIFAVARRLNYQPNSIASRLASKATNTIGVFLLDLHNDLFADIHDGIREATAGTGKHLVLSVGSIEGELDATALAALIQSRVDIIIAAGLLLPDDDLLRFSQGTRIVSTARRVPGLDSVYSDNPAGATAATRHLLELGHKRIAFLANPQTDGYRERRQGFIAQMEKAGLTPQVVASTYSREQAALDVAPLLDSTDRPTAIFAHNDQSALGVLDAMASRGLHAPADISVIGYDNTSASKAPGVALTTVDIHAQGLGRTAAEVALQRLQDPAAEIINRGSTPTLVVRGTTGKPRSVL